MTDKCLCLVPDENENCVECGKHITLPDVEAPDLGDIVGIIKLIDTTVNSYSQMIVANSDPQHPDLPRFHLIGGVLFRIPHKALYKALFAPSYKQAKTLGYRGSFSRWQQILTEAAAIL